MKAVHKKGVFLILKKNQNRESNWLPHLEFSSEDFQALVLDLNYLHPSNECCFILNSSLKSKVLVRIFLNVTKSCVKLIPSFILNMVPSFTDLIYLRLHFLKLGMKQGMILGSNFKLLGAPKRQRDFQDNSITPKKKGGGFVDGFTRG